MTKLFARKKYYLKVCVTVVLMLLLVGMTPIAVLAETISASANQRQLLLAEIDSMLASDRETGELVVILEEGVSLDAANDLLDDINISIDLQQAMIDNQVGNMALENEIDQFWFVVTVPETEIQQKLLLLSESEIVSDAMPNTILYPDDLQADFDETDEIVEAEANAPLEGYDPNTTSWAMQCMGVSEAWKAGFKGNDSITIAVFDTGYNAHADVGSACIDMSRAANVTDPIDALNHVYGTNVTDLGGHGTFVIGQICASLNSVGVNGVCRNIKVVPVKISYPSTADENKHVSNTSLQIAALNYAKKIEADIINMSWSASGTYEQFEAVGYEGLFVCSAGNNNSELTPSLSVNQAKANNDENWIVVGNMNSNYERARDDYLGDGEDNSSNYGAIYVDIFAPGADIHGLDKNGSGYTDKGGTSMASPHVAAAAALIMSHATHLTPAQVRELIIENAIVTTDLTGLCVANGYLSIKDAVYALYSASRPAYSRGDVSGDGKINAKDYMMAKRIVLGTYSPTAQEMQGADASGDGVVGLKDYMMLRRHVFSTYYIPPV